MSYRLVNAEERERAESSFAIPSRQIRAALSPGNFARLVFVIDPPHPSGITGERIWVEVTHRLGDRYRGRLYNQPQFVGDIRHGEIVDFGPEHVADFWPGAPPATRRP